MAYTQDFSTDVFGSGEWVRSGSSPTVGGGVVSYPADSTTYAALYDTALAADGTAAVRCPAGLGIFQIVMPYVRASGSFSAGHPANGYAVLAWGGNPAKLLRRSGGVETDLTAGVGTVPADTELTVTVGAVGTTITGRIFRHDTSEYLTPAGEWQSEAVDFASVTDSAVAGDGKVGFAGANFGPGGMALDDFAASADPPAPVRTAARDYYVDAAAGDDDAGDGTFSAPYETIAKALAGEDEDGFGFAAGDRLFLRGDQTHDGPIVVDCGGRHGVRRPCEVRSYGGGRATVAVAAEGVHGLDWLDGEGPVVEDIDFRGPGAGDGFGVYHHLTDETAGRRYQGMRVRRVTAAGFLVGLVYRGLYDAAATAAGIDDTLVEDCEFNDNLGDGVNTFGGHDEGPRCRRTVIRRTRCVRNRGLTGTAGSWGNGILLANVDDGLIEDCYAADNGGTNDAEAGSVGIWLTECDRTVIRGCRVDRQRRHAAGFDGHGFDLDIGCRDCVIERCQAYDCDGAGAMLWASSDGFVGTTIQYGRNVVRDCLFAGCGVNPANGFGGIYLTGNGSGSLAGRNYVYRNTVVLTVAGRNGLGTEAGVDVTFANNVVVQTGTGAVVQTGTGHTPVFDGNLYHRTDGTTQFGWAGGTQSGLAAFRAASSQEASGREADPLLAMPGAVPAVGSEPWQYDPLPGSPALYGGVALAAAARAGHGGRDLLGRPIPVKTQQLAVGCMGGAAGVLGEVLELTDTGTPIDGAGALRLGVAWGSGVTAGSGTASQSFRSADGTKSRIAVTVTSGGNRTARVLDPD